MGFVVIHRHGLYKRVNLRVTGPATTVGRGESRTTVRFTVRVGRADINAAYVDLLSIFDRELVPTDFTSREYSHASVEQYFDDQASFELACQKVDAFVEQYNYSPKG